MSLCGNRAEGLRLASRRSLSLRAVISLPPWEVMGTEVTAKKRSRGGKRARVSSPSLPG